MTLLQVTSNFTGEIGVKPRLVRVFSPDNYATVTSQNYLSNAQNQNIYSLQPTDFVAVTYNGGFGWFNPSFSDGNITLVPTPTPGSSILPVISGNFTVFSGTTGLVEDLGFKPSSPSETNVIMQHGASVIANIPVYKDINGTLVDSGAAIISGVSTAWGGGGTTNPYTVNGLTSASAATANIVTSTNNVSITKVIVGHDQLTIDFSADPGANTTVSYIATTNPIAGSP